MVDEEITAKVLHMLKGRKPERKRAEDMLADASEELIKKAIELAKAGDKDMLKFLISKFPSRL